MKVKPNPDRTVTVLRDGKPKAVPLLVRDPASGLAIPAAGKIVPDGDTYWNRRLRAGDVVPADSPSRSRGGSASAESAKTATT